MKFRKVKSDIRLDLRIRIIVKANDLNLHVFLEAKRCVDVLRAEISCLFDRGSKFCQVAAHDFCVTLSKRCAISVFAVESKYALLANTNEGRLDRNNRSTKSDFLDGSMILRS